MIPMINVKAQYAAVKDGIEPDITNTIANCSFILGSNVQGFEQEATEYLGVNLTIGCASGADTLYLDLLAESLVTMMK